jgi:hypothetical protein
MATVYGLPASLVPDVPRLESFTREDGRYDVDACIAAETAFLERVQEWARENGEGDLAGQVWRYPVGDGHAIYVVYRNRPLWLIHVPIGDAWQVDEITERGLRVSDIRKQIAFEKRWNERVTPIERVGGDEAAS